MSGMRRPTRSAHSPKISAPTGRISSVTVKMKAIFGSETPNSFAMSA